MRPRKRAVRSPLTDLPRVGETEVLDTTSDDARTRLHANGGLCDGCGGAIGRFTSQCHFDKLFQKVYCAKNGCAKKFSTAPFCTGCGCAVNPFELTGCTVIPRAGGNDVWCHTCTEGVEGGAMPPDEPATKKHKLPATRHVDMAFAGSALIDAIAAGPYTVRLFGLSRYQVMLPTPGRPFIRAAVDDRALAFRLCARFNEQSRER